MTRNKYSKRFEARMYKSATTCDLDKLLRIARNVYKYDITKDQLRQYLSKRKIRPLDFNNNQVRSMGTAYKIGTEYVKGDGMTLIKVATDKWMYKQRYLYEKYHNVKLTTDDFILFLDGDRNNFEKSNLVRVSCREASIIANLRLPAVNKDIMEAAVIYARSVVKEKELAGVKPKSHKRKTNKH